VAELRRLDHVAIAVRDTDAALRRFRDELGLEVVSTERLEQPPVRLTYLDCGNCYLQLVEPLSADTPVAGFVAKHGDGLHHICFGVDDVAATVRALSGLPPALGSGRGRLSAFLPGEQPGVRVELTEFRRQEDVERTLGFIG